MPAPIMTEDRSIAGRLRSYDVVDAAITTQGPTAGGILNNPDGGQPAAADYLGVFTDLGGTLAAARQSMLDANTGHHGQLARAVDLADRRDVLAKDLYDVFVKRRHALENLFGGVRGFSVVGVSGPTLRDPRGLLKQIRETVDFLGEPKVALPAVDGFAVDTPAVAVQLSGAADELDGVLTELAQARKTSETTRLEKNEAIDAYDRQFLYVGRTLEGLFHLAGMHDAAERVRPSVRRPGRTANEEPEPDEGVPPADQGSAAAPEPASEGPSS